MICFNEDKDMFGKCPICGAIVSLDNTQNVLCDSCSTERVNYSIVQEHKDVVEP
jgi:hypothetical protein